MDDHLDFVTACRSILQPRREKMERHDYPLTVERKNKGDRDPDSCVE